LIETSLQEIEHGNQITDKTAEALQKVVEGIEDLANESKKAMEESKAQADAMMQIDRALNRYPQWCRTTLRPQKKLLPPVRNCLRRPPT